MRREKKNFDLFRQDLRELIDAELPEGHDHRIYQDMLMNVAQLRQEKLDILELRLLNTALKELRYALTVFKPYRNVPKAAVFGSARTRSDHPDYVFASEFGRKLAKKGWMVITGGASGIMEAAMVGAGASSSFGLNILLPFEQSANAVILGNKKLVFFRYFFTRKLMFLKESSATVLFPGGFGTFDEGFESFTLVQTGKARPRPLIVMDTPKSSFWRSTLALLKRNLGGGGLISPEDLTLIQHFQDADASVKAITGFYRNYDSSRFLRDRYLIRVRKPVTQSLLRRLDREFKDILTEGCFERLSDVAEDDVKAPDLDRIAFHFDRSGYARLRQLIDVLNAV